MLRFAPAGASHVGLVRPTNQDSAVATERLLLVADGVGGGAAGEIASAISADAILASVAREANARVLPVVTLADGVRLAQERVADAVRDRPEQEGMATTLTALLCTGREMALVHLGDSRAYLLRGDELIQLTRDHTWTARAVDRGQISENEAVAHPWRNVILRSINGVPGQVGDVLPLALRVGDRMLLASDGLTDLVSGQRIEELCAETDDQRLCDVLVAEALAAGGRDNITVVVATVVDAESHSNQPLLLGSVADQAHVR